MSNEYVPAFLRDPRWKGSKPGLERIGALLGSLGNPEKDMKFVHVVGTNGKGSTCACISSCLTKAGYRTGLYISPYVLGFNEQMQVDGRHISDSELDELAEAVKPHAEAMPDPPTEFELTTAMALLHFRRKGCDIAVLEAGMGGAEDATNIIGAPEVAVVCAISYDHCQWLGGTLAEIAEAKSGVIKRGCDAAVYGSGPEADEVVAKKCAEAGARIRKPDFSLLNIKETGLEGCVFDYGGMKDLRLPLAGSYQPKNAALAITALGLLRDRGWNITDENIADGLASVRWPGRYEVISKKPVVILDGSHNPHGMEATAESLKKHFGDKKLIFVIGVMADKDVGGMLKSILPLAERFFAVEPPNTRAMKAERLAELISSAGGNRIPAHACATVSEGVEAALNAAGPEGAVVAIGSLYFSAEIRSAVEEAAARRALPSAN